MTTLIHDFQHNVLGAISIAPGTSLTGTGDQVGDAISMDGTIGQTNLIGLNGASTNYTDYSIDWKIQESGDGSTDWTDIDPDDVQVGALPTDDPATNDNSSVLLSVKNRSKQYVRAHATVVGAGSSVALELAAYIFGQQEST